MATDHFNITADVSVTENVNNKNNVLLTESTTDKPHNCLIHPRQPVKQQSSDSYTDESQLNTFDKSEDEILFSDSIAVSAFNTGRGNIWQNEDIHGIITWQTDTSPSDNLENDENFFCSFSTEHTPSEDIDLGNRFNNSSPQLVDTGNSVNDFKPETPNNRFTDVKNNSSKLDLSNLQEKPSNKLKPLEQLMQKLQRTPSCETSPTIPSPGASG